jgi:RHS repeat-associated protein
VQLSKDQNSGVQTDWCYDPGNRLVNTIPTSGTAYAYAYDGSPATSDGNIISGNKAGSLTFNAANEVTTSGWGYDHDGNLTADPSNGTLAYNDASQLISASAATGGGDTSAAESFTYAGAGNNQPLSDGSATGITYGLADQYGQPWVDSYTTGGAASYVIRDQQGDPLGMVRGGKSYMYLTDNLGSVLTLVGSDGANDGAYAWTPYGTLSAKSAGSGGSLVTQNLIGYTGALTDTYTAGSTGYVHDGARWYNPATGIFTSQDTNSYLANPANGNRYAYAADNPANNTDPTGMFSWSGFFTGLGQTVENGMIKGLIAGCIGGAIAGEGVGCIGGAPIASVGGGLIAGANYIYDSFAPLGGSSG